VRTADRRAAGLRQPGRQHIRPAVVAVDSGAVAVRDRIADVTTARAPGAASTMTSLTKSRETIVESAREFRLAGLVALTMKAVS